ncbi:acetolactate decarboxylase [Chryseobacterium sp. RR2-3-20]|uniref:acetolactate decarboxylase n=1 Tax=Chryseobacterium sp. RR2-3-20 TaxID=2787626 RepID=UPI001ADF08D3|nr:acetolactate decarboxylase [Chryseobacterium sp. RR2-3-20]
MKIILSVIFLTLGISCFSQKVINGFAMPESITSDGKRYFVSNQGQDVFSEDADGFISEISEDGKLISLKFLPETGVLNAPKGMAIDKNILYVADLNRVIGFDIDTKKTVFELKVPDAKILNDVCLLSKGFIGVTETLSGNIYRINTQNKSFEIIGNIPTANGINYNAKTDQIVVCTNGKNYGDGSIYIKSGKENFKKLPNIANGFFDGVEWLDNTHLLISDWVSFPTKSYGKLWTYDLENQKSDMLLTEESIADIYYNQSSQKIFMPQMLKNRVLIINKKELEMNEKQQYNRLYQYGVADAFVCGLYKGTKTLKELKLKGDFGLGAPDMLDGELTMLNGKIYQTKATGETIEPDDNFKSSLLFTTFFNRDNIFKVSGEMSKEMLLKKLDEKISNKNTMYAIKVTGHFKSIRTRAFPPVKTEPFPSITTIFDTQKFFDFSETDGVLIGYYLPEYLNGINSKGFHFHYLSDDKMQGGHVLDFTGNNLVIELAEQNSFQLEIPKDKDFQNFKFTPKDNDALKRVEQGQ